MKERYERKPTPAFSEALETRGEKEEILTMFKLYTQARDTGSEFLEDIRERLQFKIVGAGAAAQRDPEVRKVMKMLPEHREAEEMEQLKAFVREGLNNVLRGDMQGAVHYYLKAHELFTRLRENPKVIISPTATEDLEKLSYNISLEFPNEDLPFFKKVEKPAKQQLSGYFAGEDDSEFFIEGE